jgi:hypothetical protein
MDDRVLQGRSVAALAYLREFHFSRASYAGLNRLQGFGLAPLHGLGLHAI